ncbi:N-acetyl sugar amidotransferase [Candidatus Pelagibacter sp. Uisw_121]|uniref:N-acetyl sugar amidotransferase n=1 Tax=Candidatus Pelagibacter sp. Uisw_121 TaxID=3230987 RepID=UPI0039E74EE0
MNKNLEKVSFCKKCVISNQKVLPSQPLEDDSAHSNKEKLSFKDGVCFACLEVEKKYNQHIDWEKRETELKVLLEKYRSRNGSYDCLVPGSGGKDSVWQAHVLKTKYGMNPLTVTFSPHIYTDVGMQNFHNWPLRGGVPNFLYTPNGKIHGKLTSLAFKNLLHPFQPFILGQRHFSSHMAKMFDIKLIFHGESQAEAGGQADELGRSDMLLRYWSRSKNQNIKIAGYNLQELKEFGISENDLKYYLPLDVDEIIKKDIKLLYLGHWERCEPQENYYLATKITNFKPNDLRTESTFSKYSGIDDRVDPFHFYTAYVKFGYGRCSEDASKEIRNQYITRDEGVKLVHKYDHEFPKRYFKDFLEYTNIKEEEFYETLDSFRSPLLWEKTGNDYRYCNNWKLKHSVV